MNEPIQHAQKSTGIVTAKQLLAVLRSGHDGLGLRGAPAVDRASYSDSWIFTLSSTKGDRKTKSETSTRLEMPGYTTNGNTSERTEHGTGKDRYVKFGGVYKPSRGFWYLTHDRSRLLDIVELLPADAEVAFRVSLDAGTHEYLVRANTSMNYEAYEGLHADHLYLMVRYTSRGKVREREYLIDYGVTPHNTTRFGSPGSVF